MIPLTVGDPDGTRWRVLRAWPADAAVIAELVAEPGNPGSQQRCVGDRRLRAARWDSGRLQVLPFGSDSKLPALTTILSANRSGAEPRLLVHRHGKRAVVRGANGFTKILRPGRAAEPMHRHRAAAQVFGPWVQTPAIVDHTNDTLTVSALDGRSLGELGRDPQADVEPAWAAVGELLGGLVRTSHSGDLPEHSAGDEAAIVTTWVHRLARTGLLDAVTADRLVGLARSVAEELTAGDTGNRAPAHRDLHDGQLLWNGTQLGLIDLDTAAVAEPAIDAGNLLAHLELRARQWRAADGSGGVGSSDTSSSGGTGVDTGVSDEKLAPPVAARAAKLLLAGIDPDPVLDRRIRTYQRAAVLRLIGVYCWRPRWRAMAIRWAHELAGTAEGTVTAVPPAEDESSLMTVSFSGHRGPGGWKA